MQHRIPNTLTWAALVLTAAHAGCDLPGKPKESDRPVPADQIHDFKILYHINCRACHGIDGKEGPGPPLNDPLFLSSVPPEELRRVITKGRHDTAMPAFAAGEGGPLTARQVAILARGLETEWAPASKVAGVPAYLLADAKDSRPGVAKAGLKVYARACSTCHGGKGKGGSVGKVSSGAINDRAFLGLVSDQALRRYIITGRPDLGMPDYRGTAGRAKPFDPLTAQEIADLVVLLAAWRDGTTVEK